MTSYRQHPLSPARRAKLIEDEMLSLAAGFASGGLERIAAAIEDPVEQFRFIAEVRDAETLLQAVRVISKKEREHARRRRAQPPERVARATQNIVAPGFSSSAKNRQPACPQCRSSSLGKESTSK